MSLATYVCAGTHVLIAFHLTGVDLRAETSLAYLAKRTMAGLPTHTILDLGTGTGTSARALANACPTARVLGMDTSREMLRVAKATTLGQNITYTLGNAETTGVCMT